MHSSFRASFFFSFLVCGLATLNCGGSQDGSTFSGGPPVTGSGGAGGGGGGRPGDASTAGSLVTVQDSSARVVLSDAEVCAEEDATGDAIPVDMFIMLDQSTSMSEIVTGTNQTRWQAVTTAIVNFLNAPEAAPTGVGIPYFGLPAPGGSLGAQSCDPNVYSAPDVEIGRLTTPGVIDALTQSIARHSPSNLTPTAPALAGAIAHAKTWQAAHSDRPTIVVLATDGFPSTCDPTDLQVIANQVVAPAAADGGSGSIRTFVIAAGNDSGLAGLAAISSAGGTGSPFVVVDNANSGQQITDALVRISHTNLACTFTIPVPDAGLDPSLINVRLTRTGQASQLLDLVPTGAVCSSAGGYFFDSQSSPTHVTLCPSTCDSLVTGQVKILVGCPNRRPT